MCALRATPVAILHQGKLEVCCLLTVQRLEQDVRHHLFVVIGDEVDEGLAERFVLSKLRQLRQLMIPLSHASLGVDTKNGCVGALNETTQIVSGAERFLSLVVQLGDVLW